MIPLVFSTGAGAEMRRAMGIAVFSGMLGVTAFGIFLTPVFYVLLRSRRDFFYASAFIILGSGVLVWLFGRTGLHVGASGWLFGFWGLLLARAWFERSLLDLLLAVLVFFLYGGWFFGLLPRAGVSLEYHLAGAFCGVLYAALSRRRLKR